MTAGKPVDPPLENQVSEILRPPAGRSREEPAAPGPAETRDEHANVEMESGPVDMPVDREERDDPLPEAP